MTAMLVVGAVTVVAILAVVTGATLAFNALTEAHDAALDRMQGEYHAEAMTRADLHDRHLAQQEAIYRLMLDEVRDEREQIHRLNRSTDAQSYGMLERSARVPDADLGSAERHRAEALATRTRRPDAQPPSPAMVDVDGEPIVPVGFGG